MPELTVGHGIDLAWTAPILKERLVSGSGLHAVVIHLGTHGLFARPPSMS